MNKNNKAIKILLLMILISLIVAVNGCNKIKIEENDAEDTMETKTYSVDIKADGNPNSSYTIKDENDAFLNSIMDFTEMNIPMSDFLENYNFIEQSGLYTLTLYAGEKEYRLNIAPNNLELDSVLDYSKAEFTISSVSEGSVMTNPNDYETNGFVVLPYLDYIEHMQRNSVSDEKAYAVYFNRLRKQQYIKLSSELVSDIEFMLAMSNVQCVDFDEVEDTDDYFFTTDVYIHLRAGDEKMIEHEIMINEEGELGVKLKGDNMIFMHSDICNRVLDEVEQKCDFNYISKNVLTDLEKVDLYMGGEHRSAAVGDLEKIEKIFSNMSCIGFAPKTQQYNSKLIAFVDGYEINMDLDIDGRLIKLGSSFHYKLTKREITDLMSEFLLDIRYMEKNENEIKAKEQVGAMIPSNLRAAFFDKDAPEFRELKHFIKDVNTSGGIAVDGIFKADLDEDGIEEIYYSIRHGSKLKYNGLKSYDLKSETERMAALPLRTNTNYKFILYEDNLFMAYNSSENKPMGDEFSRIFIPQIEDDKVEFLRCDERLERKIIAFYQED